MHATLAPKAAASSILTWNPMLSFFRRATKSRLGSWVVSIIGIGILIGFAMGDMSNFGTGNIGFGMGSSTLAEVGSQTITDRQMSDAMQRRLQEIRQQRADADYASIIGDFEPMLDALMDQKTLLAFAAKYGFPLSKRLVDAEIAQIPQTKGLNGQFSDQAYQQFLAQQRLSDGEVREILAGGLLQRLLLTPVATNARVSVGMARPYASMMLESREGEAAGFPLGAFRAGFTPTDADLQKYYAANRNRYIVPEQRALRIARMGSDQVANVTASDQEITAYYNAHKAEYAAIESRTISQAVVPDQATANAIATRAKGGATIAAAAAPAGANAAVTTLADQSREAYAEVAGDKAAASVFAAPAGGIVGPLQSDFGWVVAKVESAQTKGGKPLAEARSEIAAKLNADKRTGAIEELVNRVQNAVDEGSNFTEAAAAAKLPVTTTPLVVANGSSRTDPAYKFPVELAPALKTGFEIVANDPPEIVTLPDGQGYAMVAAGDVRPAAPAPLETVRDKVASDWTDAQATAKARTIATQVQAKVARGMPLAQAIRESGAPLPPVRPLAARRIQIATAQGPVPEPMKVLFTLAEGKSRMFPDPEGRGFFIVKVDKIVPGNATLQPALIGRMQSELQEGVETEYARQFLTDLRRQMKAERNESAIQAEKARLLSSGG
jgi:peptidyl-prolyl cis-trans isomerase D